MNREALNPESIHEWAANDAEKLSGRLRPIETRRGDFGIVTTLESANSKELLVCKTDRALDPREALMHEALVEGVLCESGGSPLQLPLFEDLSKMSENGRYYLIKRYIEGAPLNDETIEKMSERAHEVMGRRVARFVAWMNETLSPYEYGQLVESVDYQPIDIFTVWWNENMPLYELIPPDQEGYKGLAEYLEYQCELMNSAQDSSRVAMIGHRDLRPDGNLIFQEDELVGVIDFGAAGPTTPEQEFRHLALYGHALEAAADEFHQLTGYSIDLHKTRTLCSMHVFVNIVSRATRLKERRVGYDLRLDYLREQYSQFDLPDMLEDPTA